MTIDVAEFNHLVYLSVLISQPTVIFIMQI